MGWLSFFSPSSLVLVSILSTGYIAHYNAPKYYHELRRATPQRFDWVVRWSFGLSAVVYACIASLGFLTFGSNCAGFILNNYSIHDPLATISRFGIAFSLISAYPLLFLGGRDGILQLFQHTPEDNNDEQDEEETSSMPINDERTTSSSSTKDWWSLRLLSVLILFIVTALAIFLSNLTFVLSFGGATLSSTIIYIFPPLMLRALVAISTTTATTMTIAEYGLTQDNVRVAMWMLYAGVVLGVCGATVSVMTTFG